MKHNTLFSHKICVFSYLSHVDVWIREYGLCVSSYIYTPVKQDVVDYCLKVSKHITF